MAELTFEDHSPPLTNEQRRRAAMKVCESLGVETAIPVLLALGLVRRESQQLVLVQDEYESTMLPPPFDGDRGQRYMW